MSTIYPEGTFKEIDAETVIASTMHAHKKLEVSFDEIYETRTYFNKRLKDTETNGRVEWDSEGIKRLKREDNTFSIGQRFVHCSDWTKVEDILSYCDINILNFIFELKDKLNNKRHISKEKEFSKGL